MYYKDHTYTVDHKLGYQRPSIRMLMFRWPFGIYYIPYISRPSTIKTTVRIPMFRWPFQAPLLLDSWNPAEAPMRWAKAAAMLGARP